MKFKTALLKPLLKSFTLVELIIVVIIVGILASLGLTQYSLVVEKARLAEAKVRIGVMRNLAYEYYLNNGVMTGIQNADLGVDGNCSTSSYYKYWINPWATGLNLAAQRCTSGGKAPNASRGYTFFMGYYPGTGQSTWDCYYDDTLTSCFGL
jgi:prepilin-type N-terminal cleavage/methylation domain-containing protein